jgi:hypothetical protein
MLAENPSPFRQGMKAAVAAFKLPSHSLELFYKNVYSFVRGGDE